MKVSQEENVMMGKLNRGWGRVRLVVVPASALQREALAQRKTTSTEKEKKKKIKESCGGSQTLFLPQQVRLFLYDFSLSRRNVSEELQGRDSDELWGSSKDMCITLASLMTSISSLSSCFSSWSSALTSRRCSSSSTICARSSAFRVLMDIQG
jgi:hypothetical protein